ncbi:MAG TPA: hypothetical protein VFI13_09160 [Gemmatimonadales bacterium]|nr:hypothetical protein [Gemmatimonadales bacterium]
MTWSRFVAILAFATAAPAALAAQQASLHPRASVLFVPPAAAADSTRYPSTHWKEGALIGGAVGGILGFALGEGFCHFDESPGAKNCTGKASAGAVLGALLFAIPGALIGGQIRKGE